jgi:CRP-like cAMP-binding protein
MLDITKSLSDEELEKLADMSVRRTFEVGTVLVSEGDIAQSIDVIIHGIVESSVRTKAGDSKVVDQLRSGQYFGLTSMVMDTPAFLQFTASTNVTLIRIDIVCLRGVLTNRPDLHEAFAEIMKQRMDAAQDVRLASNKSETRHTFRDVLHRIEMLVR